MKITIVGTGYVGLVTGACFAEMGNDVTCVDIDTAKLARLREGVIPIHEPGLDGLVKDNAAEGRLNFTSRLEDCLEPSQVIFIAVGTPPNEDGSADLSHVIAVAEEIGRKMQKPIVVVDKSTVPIGTADKVRAAIAAEQAARGVSIPFDVVSNPEFLKEGAAIEDFMSPDRIIIGTASDHSRRLMRELYAPFSRNHDKLQFMGVRDAEMTKYAANAMLATKISFMNEIAAMCEHYGVDVENVRKGIGSDQRIGYAFIYPGAGYGGSCFPKDVRALIAMAEAADVGAEMFRAVEARNQVQKTVLFAKIVQRYGDTLSGKTFAVWGLAFKPETDDVREAPALAMIEQLTQAGVNIRAYDPKARATARAALTAVVNSRVHYATSPEDAIAGADALVIMTEWKVFRQPDFRHLAARLRDKVIFDGRNMYDPDTIAGYGLTYHGIGRSSRQQVTE